MFFQEEQVAEVFRGIRQTACPCAACSREVAGRLVVISEDEIGLAGLKIDTAIVEGRPDVEIVLIILCRDSGLYRRSK